MFSQPTDSKVQLDEFARCQQMLIVIRRLVDRYGRDHADVGDGEAWTVVARRRVNSLEADLNGVVDANSAGRASTEAWLRGHMRRVEALLGCVEARSTGWDGGE